MASDRRGGLPERGQEQDDNTPMMAIFGGMFALMLVFLLLVNLSSGAAVRERLERGTEEGQYRIERMDGGSGFVVIAFPEMLRIVETGESVPRGRICRPESPFPRYARRVYTDDGDQLLWFILEGGVPTMAESRGCLRDMWPDRTISIGWVIADNDLLKSVALDDIPSYIRDYVGSKQ